MPLISETLPAAILTAGLATFSLGKDWLPAFPLYYPDTRPLEMDQLRKAVPETWVVFAHTDGDKDFGIPEGTCMRHVDPETAQITSETEPGRYVTSLLNLMTSAVTFLHESKVIGTAHLRLVSFPSHKMDLVWLTLTDAPHEDRFFIDDTFSRWGGGTVVFTEAELVKAVADEQESADTMHRRLKDEGHDISALGG